jgi:thymidylate synthase
MASDSILLNIGVNMVPGPQPGMEAPSADEAWQSLLGILVKCGQPVKPRGQDTREVLHHINLTTDLNRPVITCPARKLNYHFMAAEALWIVTGRNDVEFLAAHNARMREFSDDGKVLAGAYGPRIQPQLPYVVRCLLHDRDTRQAALTIWTQCPAPSKDIPCTIAMVFSIRGGRLYQHVFMRSSDAWLGVPYDVFSFAMVAVNVACQYNAICKTSERIGLGHQTITMTSSHLYQTNLEAATAIIGAPVSGACLPVPEVTVCQARWDYLRAELEATMTERRKTGPWQR